LPTPECGKAIRPACLILNGPTSRLFHDAYTRLPDSFFGNSELGATGTPSEAEVGRWLGALARSIARGIFRPAYLAPVTDGSGIIRETNALMCLCFPAGAGLGIKD